MATPFTHSIRVRFAECDAQGVAFNSQYLVWVDVAMTELWRVAVPGGYQAMVAGGADTVVAEARLRYRAPARFDDVIAVEALVVRMGETGMTTELRVVRDGTLLTDVELRYVFVEPGGGGKTAIPQTVRDGLTPYYRASDP